MSRKTKTPGQAIGDAVASEAKRTATAEGEMNVDASTVTYPGPAPASSLPKLQVVDVPAGPVLPPRLMYNGIYDPMRAPAHIIQAGREQAQKALDEMDDDEAKMWTIAVDSRTGFSHLRRKVLSLQSDPFVKEMGQRLGEVKTKIASLLPDLTPRQRVILEKMMKRATQYNKGKKDREPKQPSAKDMDKVLFRALEFQASRRAAQLRKQAMSARRERHALQQHKRPIALADGRTVGLNRRYQKKIMRAALISDAASAAKATARQEAAVLTQRNKAYRVAVARARNNKVNPKDLPAGSVNNYSRFQSLDQVQAIGNLPEPNVRFIPQ